jgi:hypothetical protein
MEGYVCQTIYLPDVKDGIIRVSLRAKPQNLNSALLKVIGCDSKENTVCTASSLFKETGDFSSVEVNIPATEVAMLI